MIHHRSRFKSALALLTALAVFCMGSLQPVLAQSDAFPDEYNAEDPFLEDSGFLQDEDAFFEEGFQEDPYGDTGDGYDQYNEPLNENQELESFEQGEQPLQDDEYVDEDVLPDDTRRLLESQLLQQQDFLSQERKNLPLNFGYGVGTGLMIGGWFALLTAGTSRDTLRSIGLGIVLGGVMGVVIGTRAVITPDSPRPLDANPDPLLIPEQGQPPAPENQPQGLYPPDNQGYKLAFNWKF